MEGTPWFTGAVLHIFRNQNGCKIHAAKSPKFPCPSSTEVGDLLELYCKACEEGNVTRQDWFLVTQACTFKVQQV